MITLQCLSIILIVDVYLAAAGSAPAKPQKVRTHWTGRSGGYAWSFTSRDVSAVQGRRTALSLRQALFPSKPDMEGLTAYETTVRPLSLVGSLLSFRRDDYWSGGAHPSGDISYTTVDAARPKRRVKLTELFPDAAVRDALWKDAVVRRVLGKVGVTTAPAAAAALVKKLELQTFGGEEGFKYGFRADFLEGFAFHHLEGDRVAVRLCVPWGTEIFRFQSTEIGLLLQVPTSLRSSLQRAARGEEGFLMREAKRRFGDRSATLVSIGLD
jgi:hypothetical protein